MQSVLANQIETELIPKIVKEGKLIVEGATPGEEIKIRSTNVKSLEVTGFALTAPYKVQVELYTFSNPSNVKKYNLVVKKTPPVPPDVYAGCHFQTLFENETIAYKDIIPLLNEVKKYPRCYYSEMNPLDAVIVMNDFTQYGWNMSNNIYNLSLDHILCAVAEIGKFHGECYALKESKPEFFNGIISKFKEFRYDYVDPRFIFAMQVSIERAIKVTENSEFKRHIPSSFLLQLKKLLSEDIQKYGQNSVKSEEPLSVIIHGDYLRNNIAFKYENDDPSKSPIDAMMFDMQTLRYASPAIDLIVLLANSCTFELRERHLEKILHFYHDTLIKALKDKLGASYIVPEKYSFDNFYKEYAKHSAFGLHISSYFLPVLHEPIENFTEQMGSLEANPKALMELLAKRGGEPVDMELAHQVKEIYDLYTKFDLSLE